MTSIFRFSPPFERAYRDPVIQGFARFRLIRDFVIFSSRMGHEMKGETLTLSDD